MSAPEEADDLAVDILRRVEVDGQVSVVGPAPLPIEPGSAKSKRLLDAARRRRSEIREALAS